MSFKLIYLIGVFMKIFNHLARSNFISDCKKNIFNNEKLHRRVQTCRHLAMTCLNSLFEKRIVIIAGLSGIGVVFLRGKRGLVVGLPLVGLAIGDLIYLKYQQQILKKEVQELHQANALLELKEFQDLKDPLIQEQIKNKENLGEVLEPFLDKATNFVEKIQALNLSELIDSHPLIGLDVQVITLNQRHIKRQWMQLKTNDQASFLKTLQNSLINNIQLFQLNLNKLDQRIKNLKIINKGIKSGNL
jgi:hypothetical protein